jgi:hypothetical protein
VRKTFIPSSLCRGLVTTSFEGGKLKSASSFSISHCRMSLGSWNPRSHVEGCTDLISILLYLVLQLNWTFIAQVNPGTTEWERSAVLRSAKRTVRRQDVLQSLDIPSYKQCQKFNQRPAIAKPKILHRILPSRAKDNGSQLNFGKAHSARCAGAVGASYTDNIEPR